ncbi:T9SS type A sorting domain-containing protein [Pontibacter lucknowensis]|uniref:Por secretion system C-terminal sorting domain-containing protein n=1 Tax=Pontibacter lucknowensis TaxID=1077936 RepID=A0A1N6Z3I4_9BACT|nr:T9SS type A sorting domain-containing protein [Pontibacter lucknowensis]SIR21357.1 Por secretion system C-terminal sorting domain-containing protein [Pontibacter lucknowensis]
MKTIIAQAVRSTALGALWVIAGYTMPVYGQAIEMGSFVTTYEQDFNTLPRTGTTAELGVNAFIPDGWTVLSSKIEVNTISISTGSSNTAALFSYGHTNSTDRALGALTADKVGDFAYNLLLQNTSGKTITQLDIAYAAEQWRVGSTNTDVQRLLFMYAIAEYSSSFNLTVNLKTGGWTTVPSLQFNSPKNKTTAGHIDGNIPENRKQFSYTLPEAIPDGYYVMLRWYDPDELQQDHGLAIDDVQVTWKFQPDYVPLPVELTKFTARTIGKGVELNWTTASELDSKHFEIERSTDARNFETVGIVNAMGTTSMTTNYTFHDREPLLGTSYYRLKQVDEDLSYTYYHVVAVTNRQAKTATVYPTLAQQELKVELPFAHIPYDAAVYDKMGRVVLRRNLKGFTHSLDVSRLGHGNYTLVLSDEAGQKQTLRFLKK